MVLKRDFDCATFFTAEIVPVTSIRDIHALLCRIEADPHACIIRGAPVAGVDLARVRRKKCGIGASFVETPRYWLMIDADGIPMPARTSILENPVEAARAVLDMLAAFAPN